MRCSKFFIKIILIVIAYFICVKSTGLTDKKLTYQLPRNVIPKHYAIQLSPHIIPGNFTFDGIAEITAEVLTDTTQIVLNIDSLVYKKIIIKSNCDFIPNFNITYDRQHQLLQINVLETISSGSILIIKIEYRGFLNEVPKGFYTDFYVDNFNKTKWFAVTNLGPMGARQMFPCFDQPAIRATFQLNVSRTSDFKTLSGSKLSSKIEENGRYRDIFEKTPEIPPYALSLLVYDSESTDDMCNFSWAKNKENSIQLTRDHHDSTYQYFDEFYQYRSQLENCGIIAYGNNNSLIINSHAASINSIITTANGITHDVAYEHLTYRFSSQRWDDFWLPRALAKCETLLSPINSLYNWSGELQFIIDQMHPSLVIDAQPTSTVVSVFNEPSHIRDMFNEISDDKSASIIRMFCRNLDNKSCLSVLPQNKLWTVDDFYDGYQTVLDENFLEIPLNTSIKNAIDSWINQPGLPIINVVRDKKFFKISQERFLSSNPDEIFTNNSWWIPVTWTTRAQSNFTDLRLKYWLSKASDRIVIDQINDDDWIIFNIQQLGYYRVNYDKHSWFRIIEALKQNDFHKIHEINRASLLSDLFNLARAEYVDYSIALSATEYLEQERNYLPWKTAFDSFSYLNRRIANENTRRLFQKHILTLMKPLYETMGFEDKNNESSSDILLRTNFLAWACQLNHHDCIGNSLRIFNKWKSDQVTQILPANYRESIFCTVIQHGPDDNWDFLLGKYFESNILTEKNTIIRGLTCSKNKKKLRQLLTIALNKNIRMRLQDSLFIFSSVYSAGFDGAMQTLHFIEDHLNELFEYYHDYHSIEIILRGVLNGLTTKKSVQKFEKFVSDNSHYFGPIQESIMPYIAKTTDEIESHSDLEMSIDQFLHILYSENELSNLPKHIYPVKYTIHLVADFGERFNLHGTVEIILNVTKDTSSIVLDCYEFDISHIQIRISATSEPLNITQINTDENDQIRIYLNTLIKAGSQIFLRINYSVQIINEGDNLHRNVYIDDNRNTYTLITTQFRKYAAQLFPCFEDEDFSAEFQFNIHKQTDSQTFSNVKLLAPIVPMISNDTWDIYEKTENISPLDLVFLVTDFDPSYNFNVIVNDVSINTAHALARSLEIGQKTFDFLESYTGVLTSLQAPELSVILDTDTDPQQSRDLIMFKASQLFFHESLTPAYMMRDQKNSIIRKIGNMFVENAVLPRSQCDIWTNKGFARYFQWLTSSHIESESQIMNQFVVYELQVSLLQDSMITLNQDNNETAAACSAISNNAGRIAGIIHMIRNAFGEKTFAENIKTYFDENSTKGTANRSYVGSAIEITMTESDFTTVFKPNSTIMPVMKSWISQSGYPLVNAKLLGKKLIFQQEEFSISRNNLSTQLYRIPITIATKSSTLPVLWLEDRSITKDMTTTDDWIIVNVRQTGFYRVNYDIQNWIKLIDALKSPNFDGIHEINRAQIIDDLFNLARADYMSYNVAFNASKYLINERSHLPWKAFFNAVSFLYERFEGYDVSMDLKKYLTSLMRNIYSDIGFELKINDTEIDNLNRHLIISWACKIDYPDCITSSRSLFNQWKNDSTKFIAPDIKQTVFCSAIKHGDINDWKFLWNKYRNSTTEIEKLTILSAYGCSENSSYLEFYLNHAITRDNDSIDKKYVSAVFESVYSAGNVGVSKTLNFVKDNFNRLYYYFQEWEPIVDLLSNVSTKISLPQQKLQLLELNKKLLEFDNSSKALNDSLLLMESNIEWVDNHIATIKNCLNTNRTKVILRESQRDSEFAMTNFVIGIVLGITGFLLILAVISYYCYLKNRIRTYRCE